jgi:diacylglycerol kinase family enzyme
LAKLLLIANPSSSQFTGGDHRTALRLLSTAYEVEAAWPRSAANARELAAAAVAAGVEVVVAMGGDGVVHHVAQELVAGDSVLGVIPVGTTNVFARMLQIPPKVPAAARLIAGPHRVRSAPVLLIAGDTEDGPESRYAVFATGFGFDAEVVRAAEQEPYRKYRFGGIHYARTALATALGDLRRQEPYIEATGEDRQARGVAILVQFHDVYTYFGPLALRFLPRPSARDLMTVLVVERLPPRRIPRIMARVLRGADLGRIPGFQVWDGVSTLELTSQPAAPGQSDGEPTGPWSKVKVSLVPEALGVLVRPG